MRGLIAATALVALLTGAGDSGSRQESCPREETRITLPPGFCATVFAGDTLEPVLARHRPTGLAEAPDGALFISDDMQGRIWRVTWGGKREE